MNKTLFLLSGGKSHCYLMGFTLVGNTPHDTVVPQATPHNNKD